MTMRQLLIIGAVIGGMILLGGIAEGLLACLLELIFCLFRGLIVVLAVLLIGWLIKSALQASAHEAGGGKG